MKKKWLAVGIILIFIGIAVVPSINVRIVKASATTYSGNNYNSYEYQRKIGTKDLSFQKKWSLDQNFDINTKMNFSYNYTSHSPIYIEHNGGFNEENGVIGGNGTIQNPYIIAGWDIDALGEYVDCIKIAGTTKYFIIQNCSIHTSNTNGIFLLGSSNGTIDNCVITNNLYGISLESSYWFGDTKNIKILNNIVVGNSVGIDFIYNEPDNRLVYNITLKNNSFLNNPCSVHILVDYWLPKVYETFSIDSSNTVDGKPIYYWVRQYNRIIPQDAGLVFLFSCNNITVTQLSLGNNSYGIVLFNTSNSTVYNNTVISASYYGIAAVSFSFYNVIVKNVVHKCSYRGIYLSYSSNFNNILHNNVSGNYAGIRVPESSYNVIDHNEANYCIGFAATGMEIGGTGNIVSNNSACNNGFEGIWFLSDNGKLINNIANYNSKGIGIGSNNSLIANNIIRYNSYKPPYVYGGMKIEFGSNNTITRNIIESNGGNGISLYCANSNSISYNVIKNNENGIYILPSDGRINHNIFSHNNIINNTEKDAFFSIRWGSFPYTDRWTENYWGTPLILPKVIHGKIGVAQLISWMKFDWHPAQEPYDIPGMR